MDWLDRLLWAIMIKIMERYFNEFNLEAYEDGVLKSLLMTNRRTDDSDQHVIEDYLL